MIDLVKILRIWRLLGKGVNNSIVTRVIEWSPQVVGYLAAFGRRTLPDDIIPWTPLEKKLSECRVSFVSTAGLYVKGQEPFDVDSGSGDPSFREIPSFVDLTQLDIAHTHYPIARAQLDVNVIAPFEPLRELVENKVLGDLSPRFFSFGFGGFLKEEYIKPGTGTAHHLVRKLREDGVDVVLLAPA